MTTRSRAATTAAALLSLTLLTSACTGGTESNAAEEPVPGREAPAAAQEQANARGVLQSISDAIPVYAGADFRTDLTKRDEVMIRGRYGNGAQVYTLATNDSFPQVYHYYTTYLAQFRGFPSQNTYPPERKDWRTLEVQLNQAMQDPFVPGRALDLRGRQVTLQVVETEAEPRTVIRYIVTPGPPATPAVAGDVTTTGSGAAPSMPAAAPPEAAGSAPAR